MTRFMMTKTCVSKAVLSVRRKRQKGVELKQCYLGGKHTFSQDTNLILLPDDTILF